MVDYSKLHRLDAYKLDELLKRAGFPEPDVAATTSPAGYFCRRSAWAKAMAESGGYEDIIGGPNPNGSYDYGLFQINDIHRAELIKTGEWGPVVPQPGQGVLDAEVSAKIVLRWTGGGKNWSTWGLGLSGWAGSLHESNYANWLQIQNAFDTWYARYPSWVAEAKYAATATTVVLKNLVPNARNNDVKIYQNHLRTYLISKGILGTLNPSGATGFYGSETKAMTTAVYRYVAKTTGENAWLRGDLTTPGPKMLAKIGLKAV